MNRLTLISFLSLAFVGSMSAQTLLSEDFSDNSRTNQSLSTSSAWYLYSGGTTTLSAPSGALVFNQNATTPVTTNLITYFTGSGSPRTIADGETISVNFSMTVSNTNNTAGSIRFGLFNSGASRVAADDTAAFSNAAFTNYTGYQVGISTGATATNYSINERTGTNTSIFAGAATTQLNPNPTNVAIGAIAATPFNVSLSIARSGTSYLLTSTVNGQTTSISDGSISSSAFDTFALQYSTTAVNAGGTITIDNVVISAVPEPSTYAALAGLGVLGLAVARRRRVA